MFPIVDGPGINGDYIYESSVVLVNGCIQYGPQTNPDERLGEAV